MIPWPTETNFRFGSHSVCDARSVYPAPPVVSIEKSDQFAPAFRNAVIKGRGLAAVGLTQYADLGGELTQDFRQYGPWSRRPLPEFRVRRRENPATARSESLLL